MTSAETFPVLSAADLAALRDKRHQYINNLVALGCTHLRASLTAEELAEMVCLSRRAWQRIASGRDQAPRSVLKLFCLETGLTWENHDPREHGWEIP